MQHVLISVVENIDDDFNELYTTFIDAGFRIEVFEAGLHRIQVDTLPLLIDYVRNKEDYSDGIGHLVVASNIPLLLIPWYRCYNSLTDAYVYMIHTTSEKEQSYIPDEYLFLESMADLKAIELEQVRGKIYLNISYSNYDAITPYLMERQRFRYFDTLDNFKLGKGQRQEQLQGKTYRWNGYIYKFGDENCQEIDLNAGSKKVLASKEQNQFVPNLFQHSYFIKYALMYLLKTYTGDTGKTYTNLIDILFRARECLSSESLDELYEALELLANRTSADFKNKVNAYSFMVIIGRGKPLLRDINRLMMEDSDHIEYLYRLFSSSLFYETSDGLHSYTEIYRDREMILEKMIHSYAITMKCPKRLHSNRIVLLVPQLLNNRHSPTMIALNFAKNIREFHPEYNVMIVVEDFNAHGPDEPFIPYAYDSNRSSDFSVFHKNQLSGLDIQIHYSDAYRSHSARLRADLHAIYEYDPKAIIVVGNSYSLIHRMARRNYPIVYRSIGDIIDGQLADVYLSLKDQQQLLEKMQKHGLKPPAVIKKHNPGFVNVEPRKQVKREYYSVNKNDFVMVTVGNRLQAEVSNEFADVICRFMLGQQDAYWFIVGTSELSLSSSDFDDLRRAGKIKYITYEEDLPALYTICDVYLNPERQGGGVSAAMAMAQGIPVLSPSGLYDVTAWLGQENAVPSLQDYYDELVRLKTDLAYRKNRQTVMRDIIESYSVQNSVKQLVEFCQLAAQIFNDRQSQSASHIPN